MVDEFEKNTVDTENVEKLTHGWGYRHVQTVILFMVMTCAYISRVNMSVAIIAMTDESAPKNLVKTFTWSKSSQDFILGSFYWGYTIMQIPGGQLAHRYGGKRFIALGLTLNGLAMYAIPFAATVGEWQGVCFFRALQGISQGCLLPSIHTILGKWSPLSERNRMGTFIYMGASFGMLVALPLSGILATTNIGWPSIFYSSGTLSIIVGITCFILGADSPAKHPFVSHEERIFIEDSLGNDLGDKVIKVPWKAILTSRSVLSLALVQGSAAFGFMMMINETPSYLKMALKVDVKNSAFLSTLPSIAGLIFSLVASQIADTLVNRKILSVIAVRKLSTTIGNWLPSLLLILLTMVPVGSLTLSICLITLISGFDSLACTGFLMNHIDLSPKFAGTLMSLGNFIASTAAYLAPLSAGIILTDPSDHQQWWMVFFLASGIYFVGNLGFIIFGSADRQPWDNPDYSSDIGKLQAERDQLLATEKTFEMQKMNTNHSR